MKYLLYIAVAILLSACAGDMKLGINDYMSLNDTKILINDQTQPNDKVSAALYNELTRYDQGGDCDRFLLKINHSVDQEKYAIQTNSVAIRNKAILSVAYSYIDLVTKQIISAGTITRSGSYYVEDSTYSTYVAHEDELRNLAYATIEEMLTQISVDRNNVMPN